MTAMTLYDELTLSRDLVRLLESIEQRQLALGTLVEDYRMIKVGDGMRSLYLVRVRREHAEICADIDRAMAAVHELLENYT